MLSYFGAKRDDVVRVPPIPGMPDTSVSEFKIEPVLPRPSVIVSDDEFDRHRTHTWSLSTSDNEIDRVDAQGWFAGDEPYGEHQLTGMHVCDDPYDMDGRVVSRNVFRVKEGLNRGAKLTFLNYTRVTTKSKQERASRFYHISARYVDWKLDNWLYISAYNSFLWRLVAQYVEGHVEGLVLNIFVQTGTYQVRLLVAYIHRLGRDPPRFSMSVGVHDLPGIHEGRGVLGAITKCKDPLSEFSTLFTNPATYQTHYAVTGYVQLCMPRFPGDSVSFEVV